nr:flavodoxin domain-containing protein [uncultured Carboxylicivirga sp.]
MGLLTSLFKKTPKPLKLDTSKKYHCPTATILYGTKTGNAQLVAQQLQKTLEQYKIDSECYNIAKYDVNRIFSEKLLLIVMSTDGEGELPPNSKKFFGFLKHDKFPQLADLKYSICALGDSSYEYFCGAGKLVDAQLQALGAQSVIPRVDCDVDFKGDALDWIEKVFHFLSNNTQKELTSSPSIDFKEPDMLEALLTDRYMLTKGDQDKATWHIVMDNSENKVEYQSGDCIEIIPENPDQLVAKILDILHIDSEEFIDDSKQSVFELLKYKYELTKLNRKVVRNYYAATSQLSLSILINDQETLNKYVSKKDVLDLITDYPSDIDAATLTKILSPLQSRYYSIASGYKATPDEIHLTIKTIRFEEQARFYEGAASVYMNEGLQKGTKVHFRLIPSLGFHLPEDSSTPVILIGIGTGIAPYRGFLQDLKKENVKDQAWLIWGDKKQAEDFLYEDELQEYLQSGYIKYLDTAFSRDQEEKRYVQHLLKERKKELMQWIDMGAHIYLCGHTHMGHDVRSTLSDIFMEEKGLSKQDANQQIVNMQENGLLHEDLY